MSLFRRKPQDVPPDPALGDPRAQQLVDAVEADDADAIGAALTGATSPEERERLHAILADLPGHMATFDAWVERAPDDRTAILARGAYGVGWAWEARGGGRAETVGEDQFEEFFERLRRTEDDLLRAADLDPQDPVPWSHLLTSGRGIQIPVEELRMRYDEAQSRRPWLLEAHLQLLQSLCAKWFGSDEESLEFARSVTREAPEGSPVHALVPMAHIEVWLDVETREGGSSAEYSERTDVRDEIREAAERSVLSRAFTDDLAGVQAQNIFAMGLWLFADEERARTLVERLGTRRSAFPWYYRTDGGEIYAQLRSG